MNSVVKHLTAESKAATLMAMRSAKKEVLLVVEGDTDVEVVANGLKIPRSNILSCAGKEILMAVYSMKPRKGIDEGTIFLRDRDTDAYSTSTENGILLLVTSRYDIEMELLENRIFERILIEYSKGKFDSHRASLEFQRICKAAACIGALRIISGSCESLNLDFDDLNYSKFINQKELDSNISKAVTYILAKSKMDTRRSTELEADVVKTLKGREPIDIVCSKEFLDVMQIAISRSYNACDSKECSSQIIGKMIRISVNGEDFKSLSFYPAFVNHVKYCGYGWDGINL